MSRRNAESKIVFRGDLLLGVCCIIHQYGKWNRGGHKISLYYYVLKINNNEVCGNMIIIPVSESSQVFSCNRYFDFHHKYWLVLKNWSSISKQILRIILLCNLGVKHDVLS